MSWDSYTQRLIAENVDHCAIHGRDGNVWAQVEQFQCSPNEVIKVVDGIMDKNSKIFEEGVVLANKKWTVVNRDPELHIMALKEKKDGGPKQTLIVSLTDTAVIMGASSNCEMAGGVIRKSVEGIRDYLKSHSL